MTVGLNTDPANHNVTAAQSNAVAGHQPTNRATSTAGNTVTSTTGTETNQPTLAETLGLVPPQRADTDLMVLLQQMRSKVEHTQAKVSEEQIQNAKTVKQHKAKERIAKLQEAAKGPPSWLSGLKKFGKVAGWITASALIVGGAACCFTGLGAGWGVPLMMAGAAMMAVQIAGEQGGDNWMNGLLDEMSSMFQKMGMSEEDANITATVAVATGVVVGVSALIAMQPGMIAIAPMIVPAMGGLIFTPENMKDMGLDDKDAMIASITINATLAVTSGLVSLGGGIALGAVTGGAATMGPVVTTLTALAGAVSGMLSGAMQIVQGSGEVIESEHHYQAGLKDADASELKAMMTKLFLRIQEEGERIEEIMKRVQEGAEVVMNVLRQEGEVMDRVVSEVGMSRSMA